MPTKPKKKAQPLATAEATGKEKAVLTSVFVALAIASSGIRSALQMLSMFAPKQTVLIQLLDYIVTAIDAVVNHKPLPAPLAAIEAHEAQSFAGISIGDDPGETFDDVINAGLTNAVALPNPEERHDESPVPRCN